MALYTKTTSARISVGDRVKKARLTAEMTQSDVVDHLRRAGWEWSTPTQSKIEAGMRQVSFLEMVALADLFNQPLSYFHPGSSNCVQYGVATLSGNDPDPWTTS